MPPSHHTARTEPASPCSYWEKKPSFHSCHPKLTLFLHKQNPEEPQGLHHHHIKSTGAPNWVQLRELRVGAFLEF